MIWRFSKNFVPTKGNLFRRHLTSDAICPRCGLGVEMMEHVFCICATSVVVWKSVGLFWVLSSPVRVWQEWLTWVFYVSSEAQCRLFCVSLWSLWTERNKRANEGIVRTGMETTKFIIQYVGELDGCALIKSTYRRRSGAWVPPSQGVIKVNFDGAFDTHGSRSCSGLVVRNSLGQVLTSKAIFHDDVRDAFCAKAYVCADALCLCVDLRVQTVVVEGNSRSIIKKDNLDRKNKSIISPMINDIQTLRMKFRSIQFQHSERLQNRLADYIAKRSLRRNQLFFLMGSVPEFALQIQGTRP